ncbi:hypothetical protein [Bacillus sp. NPDC094106]|uniref:hypothetical protein n=1 Tax=Bacillus sp. NPDC094106 TaxID=3363949 RepID=UPI00381B62F5
MTYKQIELLNQLNNILLALNEECLNDNEFNNLLAEMNGFNYSIDELVLIIKHCIESKGNLAK